MTTQTFLRSEYRAFPYEVDAIHLFFELNAQLTTVTNEFVYRKKSSGLTEGITSIYLDGDQSALGLISVELNGHLLNADQYHQTEQGLEITQLPDKGTIKIVTTCCPNKNTALSGLFATGNHLMTQCEAQGFRRMTYFADRPDVLTIYTVTLAAQAVDFPVLLSNGNLSEQSPVEGKNGWHRAIWHDPFPKPSYLFALVAGQLEKIEEVYEVQGEQKLLQVYSEQHDLPKAQFAMDSLKASIDWDIDRFGLGLDLERFMIVATSDFNMGAMENKGLNIFNSKYVMASPKTATDFDYEAVQAVVGHEYFHNWTGNRVTCQDWFQLSLKEGLTVYRDQEFTADCLSKGLDQAQALSAKVVKRISDVQMLRSAQYLEDSGPMAHPIRPNEYQEINNFYTLTIYEKGAEVVRMYETMLGRDGFRKGMDLYFKRHDGQAVTCDDFRAAMADANQANLDQFGRWYEQAGTPLVNVSTSYDAQTHEYAVTLTQSNSKVGIEIANETLEKLPLHIPLSIGLIARHSEQAIVEGQDIPVILNGKAQDVIHLTEQQQRFVFENVMHEPVLSINRGLSAPIRIEYAQSEADLLHRLKHDADPFNRWDAGQTLFNNRMMAVIRRGTDGLSEAIFSPEIMSSLRLVLNSDRLSPAYLSKFFVLPSYSLLIQQLMHINILIDPVSILRVIDQAQKELATQLLEDWKRIYSQFNIDREYEYNGVHSGQRSLKNMALKFWAIADSNAFTAVHTQFQNANNMTDQIAALNIGCHVYPEQADPLLLAFYNQFQDENLVIDKWFAAQATMPEANGIDFLEHLKRLKTHQAYLSANPNRIRSLVFAFCMQNPKQFHRLDGAGYQFWYDELVALDKANPQVASRLSRACELWDLYALPYRDQMRSCYEKLVGLSELSTDTKEIIMKTL